MKWLAVLLSLLVWAAPANAQLSDAALMNPPAWVLKPTPAIDCNFALGAYYNCPIDKTFSITRASTKYCQWQSQLWISVASGAPCITDQGWLIEEARTNLALWARDMTQTGTWVAVTMTAALNAVGIDGAANSATTLTSTSPAGTILQSLTASSTAYTYTVFVKGVTVTGNIQVADYPVLTPAFTTLTSSNCFNPVTGVGTAPASGQTIFLRCTITATSLNPVIGFKFANSGDSIIVDFNQLEAASFGTSPILTTSASATRAADNIVSIGLLSTVTSGGQGSLLISVPGAVANIANGPLLAGGGGSNYMAATTSTTVRSRLNAASNISATLGSGNFTSGPVKAGVAWGPTGYTVVGNAGTVATSASAPTLGAINLGSSSGTSLFLDGSIARLTAFSIKLPDSQLQMLTSLN
jgi:hypothetical protein